MEYCSLCNADVIELCSIPRRCERLRDHVNTTRKNMHYCRTCDLFVYSKCDDPFTCNNDYQDEERMDFERISREDEY